MYIRFDHGNRCMPLLGPILLLLQKWLILQETSLRMATNDKERAAIATRAITCRLTQRSLDLKRTLWRFSSCANERAHPWDPKDKNDDDQVPHAHIGSWEGLSQYADFGFGSHRRPSLQFRKKPDHPKQSFSTAWTTLTHSCPTWAAWDPNSIEKWQEAPPTSREDPLNHHC